MKLILFLIGIVMILVGLVLFPLPLPLGWIFLIIGTVLVVSTNKTAKKLLKKARRKWSWLDKIFEKTGKIIPKRFRKEIEETDPNGHDEDDDEDKEDEEESRQHTAPAIPRKLSRLDTHPRCRPPTRPRS